MEELRVSEAELRDLVTSRLGLLDAADFDRARSTSRRLRLPLERAIAERAHVPLSSLLAQVADLWQVGFTPLKVTQVSARAVGAIKEEYARNHDLVAFDLTDGRLSVAFWNPRDRGVITELQRQTGRQIVPHLAPLRSIRRAHLLYREDLRALLKQTAVDGATPATRRGEDATAAELVSRILEYAIVSGASDIHLEAFEHEGLVRYRVDGVLQDVLSIPMETWPALVSRIKVLSGMRIDERRAPQDGRFEGQVGNLNPELRVSSLPTYYGEKIVMRVLSSEAEVHDLDDLGILDNDFPLVLRNLMRPFGMVLITGPTGSGKTTTLYATLARLAAERHNVLNITTIEDPIEHPLPRINQTAVNPDAGITFAGGLRALLRQDPDVIMVGEIRDKETADIAVRTALVGRLLLSTLHTNDATSAVPRLIDMGIEPFLLSSTLSFVIAQRLARRVCTACRESLAPDSPQAQVFRADASVHSAIPVLQAHGILSSEPNPLSGIRLFHGRGCSQCNGTGYRGRIGVFELLEIDDRVRLLIMERRDAEAIRKTAMQGGMKTMFQDGLMKVLLGQTTFEEIVRITL